MVNHNLLRFNEYLTHKAADFPDDRDTQMGLNDYQISAKGSLEQTVLPVLLYNSGHECLTHLNYKTQDSQFAVQRR